MKAVLALAFLTLARAAIIEHPFFYDAPVEYKNIDPVWMRTMFEKYGLAKPVYDTDFVNWGKTVGVEDLNILNYMRNVYDKPSLLFFQDPTGKVVSYYAHEGVDKVNYIPELKTAFTNLYGSSDKLSIDFKPDSVLGNYRTVLPGHFFEPVQDVAFTRYLHEFPVSHEYISFSPKTKSLWGNFNFNALPSVYNKPVALDVESFHAPQSGAAFNKNVLFHDAIIPTGHAVAGYPIVDALSPAVDIPFTKTEGVNAVAPFAPVGHFAAPVVPSGMGYLRSGLNFATPAVKSGAYHLLKADYPYFTAAPFVESAIASPSSGIPLMKAASAFYTPAEHGYAFAPVHAFSEAPSGFVHAKSAAAPFFSAPFGASAYPFAKAVPCEGCLVAEKGFSAFAPAANYHLAHASGFPLMKSAFSPYVFGAEPTHASTFASYAGAPLVKTFAHSSFAEPAFAGFSPATHSIINWN